MASWLFVFGIVALCELVVNLFSDYKTLLNLFIFFIKVAVWTNAEAGKSPLFGKNMKVL